MTSQLTIHGEAEQALCKAAQIDDTKTVTLLLERGANIHIENDYALRVAAYNGRTKAVALLLARDADVHANADEALRWSARAGHKETTLCLLRYGADSTARDCEGKSAVDGTDLAEWLTTLKQETQDHFKPGKPSRQQCFVAGKKRDEVLDACVTGTFSTLIGAPLVASTDKADRQLFQDIWDALPPHWQDQHQGICMEFIKEGGINPVVGT